MQLEERNPDMQDVEARIGKQDFTYSKGEKI
jgi:hypothetical protein